MSLGIIRGESFWDESSLLKLTQEAGIVGGIDAPARHTLDDIVDSSILSVAVQDTGDVYVSGHSLTYDSIVLRHSSGSWSAVTPPFTLAGDSLDNMTDPNIACLDGSTLIASTFGRNASSDRLLMYKTSTDNGVTWGAKTTVTGFEPYQQGISSDGDAIWAVCSENSNRATLHFYRNTGAGFVLQGSPNYTEISIPFFDTNSGVICEDGSFFLCARASSNDTFIYLRPNGAWDDYSGGQLPSSYNWTLDGGGAGKDHNNAVFHMGQSMGEIVGGLFSFYTSKKDDSTNSLKPNCVYYDQTEDRFHALFYPETGAGLDIYYYEGLGNWLPVAKNLVGVEVYGGTVEPTYFTFQAVDPIKKNGVLYAAANVSENNDFPEKVSYLKLF